MYKKMLTEMEHKNEERVRDIQRKFREDIHRYVRDKEEEAKYFQSEREIFEDRISELENELNSIKE